MSGHDWVGKGYNEGYLTESEIRPLMSKALAKLDNNGFCEVVLGGLSRLGRCHTQNFSQGLIESRVVLRCLRH